MKYQLFLLVPILVYINPQMYEAEMFINATADVIIFYLINLINVRHSLFVCYDMVSWDANKAIRELLQSICQLQEIYLMVAMSVPVLWEMQANSVRRMCVNL